MMTGSGPTGFELQFQEFMFYAGSIAQLTYYVVLPIAAIWAVLLFRRMVSSLSDRGANNDGAANESVQLDEGNGASSAAGDQAVSIENFVE